MTDAGWAGKAVDGIARWRGGLRDDVVDLLKAEHARSVRIVKAEIKRVNMDEHEYNKLDKEVRLDELNIILTALQRGRGGKG